MAKYTITRACGHNEEIQVYGKYSERAAKIERESEKNCSECRKEKVIESSDLIGTEKQILWAEKIRSTVSKTLVPLLERVASAPDSQAKAATVSIIESILKEKQAHVWIENREETYSNAWIAEKVKKQLTK